jgi:hypothetical protein
MIAWGSEKVQRALRKRQQINFTDAQPPLGLSSGLEWRGRMGGSGIGFVAVCLRWVSAAASSFEAVSRRCL